MGLIKKLRKAKKEAPPNEKPPVVKTHLRDMIVVPEMIGSVVGIYNGKVSPWSLSNTILCGDDGVFFWSKELVENERADGTLKDTLLVLYINL